MTHEEKTRPHLSPAHHFTPLHLLPLLCPAPLTLTGSASSMVSSSSLLQISISYEFFFYLLLTRVLFCLFVLSQANFLTQEQINGKTPNSTGLLNVSDVCSGNEAHGHRVALVPSARGQSLPPGQLRHKRFCVSQRHCGRDRFKCLTSHVQRDLLAGKWLSTNPSVGSKIERNDQF